MEQLSFSKIEKLNIYGKKVSLKGIKSMEKKAWFIHFNVVVGSLGSCHNCKLIESTIIIKSTKSKKYSIEKTWYQSIQNSTSAICKKLWLLKILIYMNIYLLSVSFLSSK